MAQTPIVRPGGLRLSGLGLGGLRQRNLARRVGNLPDVPRHRVAGQSGAELGHQGTALGLGYLEMGGAGNPIQLVKIVRHHPKIDQPLAQLGQNVRVDRSPRVAAPSG